MRKKKVFNFFKNSLKVHLGVIWAFIVKDIKQTFRFKMIALNYIFAPLLTMISFLMVYSGIFLNSNVKDLGYVNQSNYILYLLTGFLAYSCMQVTWGKTTLSMEKYMLTLEGMLVAPRNRLYIMIGKASVAFVEVMISALVFSVLIALLHPTINWINLLGGSASLIFIFICFLCLDFIVSAIGLSEEGLASFLVNYGPKIFLVLGAVYFPIEVFPLKLRFLVELNPLYVSVNLFRSAFMNSHLPYGFIPSLIYLTLLAFLMPFVTSWFFDYVFKKRGIKGY